MSAGFCAQRESGDEARKRKKVLLEHRGKRETNSSVKSAKKRDREAERFYWRRVKCSVRLLSKAIAVNSAATQKGKTDSGKKRVIQPQIGGIRQLPR